MIAIIKYNAGNTTSVKNAVDRLGYQSVVTDDFEVIKKADKVIFPGVGQASTAMSFLKKRNLDSLIKSLNQPVLGICLGLQLLCKYSEEGNTQCMGIFDTEIKRFPKKYIVPHMGWNVMDLKENKLLKGISQTDDVYFVHSYYASVSESTTAICTYGIPFSAVLQKNNFYATQFHPEKSAGVGAHILKNFLEL